MRFYARTSRRTGVSAGIFGTIVLGFAYLIVMLQSANRDEAKWGEGAGVFDCQRPNAIDHLALGKGPHFCIGAPLGRLEGQIAIARLLTRLKNIRLAEGVSPVWQESPTFRALTDLRLEFDRA